MDFKTKTLCFSGHRKIPPEQIDAIRIKLKETITESVENGFTYFLAGGALGFDTLAAQTVLDMKEKYPSINLTLILPHPDQANRWSESDKNTYENIKSQAYKIVYTCEKGKRGCMHIRNRRLVDESSKCICYLTEATGGTAYTVKYAEKSGLDIINIADLT